MKSNELHRLILKNGWKHIRTTGSHYIYEKNGKPILHLITVQKKLVRELRKKLLKKWS